MDEDAARHGRGLALLRLISDPQFKAPCTIHRATHNTHDEQLSWPCIAAFARAELVEANAMPTLTKPEAFAQACRSLGNYMRKRGAKTTMEVRRDLEVAPPDLQLADAFTRFEEQVRWLGIDPNHLLDMVEREYSPRPDLAVLLNATPPGQ
jgi:hypothetical protein